jgi:hypothetical protein
VHQLRTKIGASPTKSEKEKTKKKKKTMKIADSKVDAEDSTTTADQQAKDP